MVCAVCVLIDMEMGFLQDFAWEAYWALFLSSPRMSRIIMWIYYKFHIRASYPSISRGSRYNQTLGPQRHTVVSSSSRGDTNRSILSMATMKKPRVPPWLLHGYYLFPDASWYCIGSFISELNWFILKSLAQTAFEYCHIYTTMNTTSCNYWKNI